jgi:hypothetical protein
VREEWKVDNCEQMRMEEQKWEQERERDQGEYRWMGKAHEVLDGWEGHCN